MVRIRLRRVGAKKQPSYRVVAADKESPRDGRFLEVLGFYNPRTEPSTIELKEDRVYHWLSVGAQPSDSVRRLFDQVGLWDRYLRFKDGDDVEKLLEEAAAVIEERDVDPRTRRDDLAAKPKKVEEPAKEEATEAEQAEEPKAEEKSEPEAEVDAEVEETPQAETEESEADQAEEAEAEKAEETEAPADEE